MRGHQINRTVTMGIVAALCLAPASWAWRVSTSDDTRPNVPDTTPGWSDTNTYLALWNFESTNASGQTVDVGGSNFHATVTGCVWTTKQTSPYTNQVYYFDGVDDLVTYPGTMKLKTTQGTIMYWMACSNALIIGGDGNGWYGFAYMNSDIKYRINLGVYRLTTSKYYAGIRENNVSKSTFLDGTIAPTNGWQWVHVAFTYQTNAGAQNILYTNGLQAATSNSVPLVAWAPVDGTGWRQIGYYTSAGRLDGWMDDVKVADYPLSSNDIYQMAVNENPTNRLIPQVSAP